MNKQAIALATVLALSGCWHMEEQAAQAEAKRAAETQALSGTQAAWTQAAGRVDGIRAALARADWARAGTEIGATYRELYSVVTAADLSPELRTRVTRLFPTLIALQSKVNAQDPDARMQVDKLAEMIKATQAYMLTSGWMRGGGAGTGRIEIKEPAASAPPRPESRPQPGLDQ